MASRTVELVSHPARLAIVVALADRPSATLGELADLAEVHPNTARAHVRALLDAGALERSSVPARGRGRPRIAYRLSPGWSLPGETSADPAHLLHETLGAVGFGVEAHAREVKLTDCPCPRLNPGAPEVICGLASAVADGVLAGSGSRRRVVGARHDPELRSCALRLG